MKRRFSYLFKLGCLTLIWVGLSPWLQAAGGGEKNKAPSLSRDSPFTGQEVKLAALIREYPRALAFCPAEKGEFNQAMRFVRATAPLFQRFNLPVEGLYDALIAHVKARLLKKDLKGIDLARFYFIMQRYQEAHDIALAVGDEAHRESHRVSAEIIAALELAAFAAQEVQRYDLSWKYLTVAVGETNASEDIEVWAQIQSDLAYTAYLQKDYPAQQKILRGIMEKYRLALGPGHVQTLRYHNELATALYDQRQDAAAEVEYRAILQRLDEAKEPDEKAIRAVEKNLATVLESLGRHAEAEPLRRAFYEDAAADLGKLDPRTISSRYKLVKNLEEQKKFTDAETELRTLLQHMQLVLGEGKTDTLVCREKLALLIYKAGRYEEAATQYQVLYEDHERILGEDHEMTVLCCKNWGLCLMALDRDAKAETLFKKVLMHRVKRLHADHEEIIEVRMSLGLALQGQRKIKEAEGQIREAMASCERGLPTNDPLAVRVRNVFSALYETPEAKEILLTQFEGNLALLEKRVGAEHADALATRNNVAVLLSQLQRHKEAEGHFRFLHSYYQRVLGEAHPTTIAALTSLSVEIVSQKRLAEGEELLRRAVVAQRAVLSADDQALLITQFRLGACLGEAGKMEESAQQLRHVRDTLVQIKGEKNEVLLKAAEDMLAEVERLRRAQQAQGNKLVDVKGGILVPSVMSGIPQSPLSLPINMDLDAAKTIAQPPPVTGTIPAPAVQP